MGRRPKGMTKEDYEEQRLLQGKLPKKQTTISIESLVYDKARNFCEERGIEFSYFIELLLKHHFTSEGTSATSRDGLRQYATKLAREIDILQKQCGALYPLFRNTYHELGGKPDASNCEEIFPKMYTKLKETKGARARLPFFETCVNYKLQHQQILGELERMGQQPVPAKVEETMKVESGIAEGEIE